MLTTIKQIRLTITLVPGPARHTSTGTVPTVLITRLFYAPRTTCVLTCVTKLSSQASMCTGAIFLVTDASVTRRKAHFIAGNSPKPMRAIHAVSSGNVTAMLKTGQRAR